MEPPDAVDPPPSVRRDALPRRRAADARHADAGMELWRIVLLGTLPIALALPLPGAAALAITSLSVPSPPVAPPIVQVYKRRKYQAALDHGVGGALATKYLYKS